MDMPSFVCAPNGQMQQYPVDQQTDNACKSATELQFLEDLLDMVAATTTSDGRHVVSSFTLSSDRGGASEGL